MTPDWIAPVKAAREAAGLSLRQFERRTGIPFRHLSLYERGYVPSEDVRRKVLEAAGLAA